MKFWTLQDWLLAGGAAIIGLTLYIVIWNRSKLIAYLVLLCSFGGIAYWTVDWAYWDIYFKVDWGGGGLTQ